jgi:hypothetical protein
MYCDLLGMAFYAVRERFYVVGVTSNATEILTVLREHPPQIVIVSDNLEEGPLAGMRILPKSGGSLLTPEFFCSRELQIASWYSRLAGSAPMECSAGIAHSICCANRWMQSLKERFGQTLRNLGMFWMSS